MTSRLQHFASAQGRRIAPVLAPLAAMILFATIACGDTIDSYNSWCWNGFTRTSAAGPYNPAVPITTPPQENSVGPNTVDGATLSGVVYYDVNANGVRESTDWAIRFATVSLTLEGNTSSYSYTTGKDGAYAFTNLSVGTYTATLLTVSDSSGTTSAGLLNGVQDTTAVTGKYIISNIVLKANDVGINYDFAQYAYPISLISKQLLMGDDGIEHTTIPVPEPGTFALLAAAGLSLLGFAWRRRMRLGRNSE